MMKILKYEQFDMNELPLTLLCLWFLLHISTFYAFAFFLNDYTHVRLFVCMPRYAPVLRVCGRHNSCFLSHMIPRDISRPIRYD